MTHHQQMPKVLDVMKALTDSWTEAIRYYLTAQRASGAPSTTCNARRQHLEHLARRVDAGPWSLTGDQLVTYAGEQVWAAETRRSRRTTFMSFYEWALSTDRTTTNPAAVLPRVKATDPNPRPAPDAVYLEALVRADPDEALWIDLAAEHGLRRAEIAVVHSSDLVPTLLGHDLTVHGKGGKTRTVPLTHAMARALLARGPGYAFPGDDHGHISPRWLGTRVNTRLLSDDWTIHKLRHRAATRFYIAADGDPYAVADLMGWANINMVRVYVKLPSDRLRNIVEGASRTGAPLTRMLAS